MYIPIWIIIFIAIMLLMVSKGKESEELGWVMERVGPIVGILAICIFCIGVVLALYWIALFFHIPPLWFIIIALLWLFLGGGKK